MEIKRDKSLDLKPDRERKKVRGKTKKKELQFATFNQVGGYLNHLEKELFFLWRGGRENGSSRNDFSVAGKELRVLFNFVVLCCVC